MWLFRMVTLLIALNGVLLALWVQSHSTAADHAPALMRVKVPAAAVEPHLRAARIHESPPMFFGWSRDTTAPSRSPLASAAPAEGFYFERFIVSEPGIPPEQVVVGDVTGDRRNDIIVTLDDWEEVRVRIYAQAADGTSAPPVDFKIPIISGVGGSVELADFDANGIPEIVVGAGAGITIFRKVPGGYSRSSYAGTVEPTSFAAIDADGDGFQDIVAQGWSDGADIYMSDGRGGIRSVQHLSTPLAGYNTLEVSDFTADGRNDLVMTNSQGWGKAWIYPFSPAGLQDPIMIDLSSVLTDVPSGMTVADVDLDGRPDLVVADEGNDISPKGIRILYRGAGNQFEDEEFIQLDGFYERPGAVRVADVDGNGYPDIVTMINSNDQMAYFLQGPSGFADPVLQRTDDNPWTNNHYWDNSFVIADVNSDRCPDVVLAEVSSSLRIFYGRNCQVATPRTGGRLPPERL